MLLAAVPNDAMRLNSHMSEMGETADNLMPDRSLDTTNLWFEVLPFGTNAFNTNTAAATLILHNTHPDETYEILSRAALPDTNWNSEGFVFGSETTNWTVTSISAANRTNALFFSARSWLDSAGIGIPDWWQLRYFAMVGVDPNADPDHDGVPCSNGSIGPGTTASSPP